MTREPPTSRSNTLLLSFLRKAWQPYGLGVLCLLLTNGLMMAVPHLLAQGLDALPHPEPAQKVYPLVGGLVLIALCLSVCRWLSRIMILNAARDVEQEIRLAYFDHLMAMAPDFFLRHQAAELHSRISNDLTQLRLLLGPGFLNVCNTFLAFALAIPAMWQLSAWVAVAGLWLYPPCLVLMFLLGRRLYRGGREQAEAMGATQSWLHEYMEGSNTVRIYGMEPVRSASFAALNQAMLATQLGLQWTRAHMMRLAPALSATATGLVLLSGGQQAFQGKLSLGELAGVVEYLGLLSWPTLALGWMWSIWQRGRASWQRIAEILQTPPAQGLVVKLTPNPQPMVMEGVRIHIGGKDVLHIPGRVQIQAQQALALVGPIGSGKSLLLQGLAGLYPLASGEIRYGDSSLLTWHPRCWRQLIAWVPATPSLLSGTVLENITFGRTDASSAQVDAIIEESGLAADLALMPQGLATRIGERGVRLSGGQKQRIALARALLQGAPVLLLDDPFSALDSTTSQLVWQALQRRLGTCTMVLATHRLHMLPEMDSVWLLAQGQLVAQGAHGELLQTSPVYRHLLAEQQAELAAQAVWS